MSLILDALRKSEAERRRGQAPDLFTPLATRGAPVDKPRIALLAIGIAAILVTSVIVFWPWSTKPPQVPENDSATTENLPSVDSAPAIATSPITPAPAEPPRAAAVAPSAPVIRKPVEPKPMATSPAIDMAATAQKPPAQVETDSIASTAAAPSSDASDSEPSLPSLATLDSKARAALPPLQLSMHVWNEDPTRRFAIIDGQRLGEGGKLAGAVVAEIRRDGVVLEIDGRQFLLPRP
jgi:general secretion pathway protein B